MFHYIDRICELFYEALVAEADDLNRDLAENYAATHEEVPDSSWWTPASLLDHAVAFTFNVYAFSSGLGMFGSPERVEFATFQQMGVIA